MGDEDEFDPDGTYVLGDETIADSLSLDELASLVEQDKVGQDEVEGEKNDENDPFDTGSLSLADD